MTLPCYECGLARCHWWCCNYSGNEPEPIQDHGTPWAWRDMSFNDILGKLALADAVEAWCEDWKHAKLALRFRLWRNGWLDSRWAALDNES